MDVRPARIEDKDGYVKNALYSYNAPETNAEVLEKRFGLFVDQFYSAVEKDVVLANGRLIPFEQNVRGVVKPMGGIASISSAPETRRSGHVREIMNYILHDMKKKRMSTSILYPFNDEFYTRFGFTPLPPFHKIRLRVEHMRRWNVPDGHYLKRMKLSEGIEHAKIIHTKAIEDTHGTIRRSDDRWEEHVMREGPECVFAFSPDDVPIGYMVYSLKNYGPFRDDERNGKMFIQNNNMFWSNLDGRNILLNYVHNHADQVVTVSIPVYPIEQDYWHWTTKFNVGDVRLIANNLAMARVVDVECAIKGLPARSDGSLSLRVSDPTCDWNNGVFKITSDGSRLSATKMEDGNEDTTVTIEGLTLLLYGTVPLDNIMKMRKLSGEKMGLLRDWFRPLNLWLTESF